MEKTGFDYNITIRVKFTKEEFDLLWKAFEFGCEQKRYLEQGEFMFGNKNRFNWGEDLLFTDRQIDNACKAIELSLNCEFSGLYTKMYNLHKMIVEEYKRITENTQSFTNNNRSI